MATGFLRPLVGRAVQRGHLENRQPREVVACLVFPDRFPLDSLGSDAEAAPVAEPKTESYHLISWELVRTSDAQAFRPVAGW